MSDWFLILYLFYSSFFLVLMSMMWLLNRKNIFDHELGKNFFTECFNLYDAS